MSTIQISHLSDSACSLLGVPGNLIGGQWEVGEGDRQLLAINPTTTEELATIPVASLNQGERAIAAAREAFDAGPWQKATARDRSDLLNDLADAMDRHRDELVEIVVSEVGSPVSLTRGMQVGMPIDNIRWAAEMATKGPQGGYEESLPPHFGTPPSSSLLRREPVGVIAGITGYNFPINSVAWKLGPALAAGCTLILKPSERTSLSTLAFVRLAAEVGLPEGVLNFVLGESDIGNLLSSHPDVDLTMFTGSLAVGRRIMEAASKTTKRLILELGGKSATIILPDADLEEVTGPSIQRWARNAGQGCGATTRTLVPRQSYERFVEYSSAFLDSMQTGDPWDEKTEVGPLIREEQRLFVEGHVEAAVAAGAVIEAGGGRVDDLPGYFVKPTVVGNVSNADEICREELFGPVGAVLPYDNVEEAIAIANDSLYGLNANVFGPIPEALAVARRIRSGNVTINGGGRIRPEAPWGGYGRSGIGRESGDEGFREYFEVKHIQWPLG
jgi:aldehyde dehydrogenase (NAD+)